METLERLISAKADIERQIRRELDALIKSGWMRIDVISFGEKIMGENTVSFVVRGDVWVSDSNPLRTWEVLDLVFDMDNEVDRADMAGLLAFLSTPREGIIPLAAKKPVFFDVDLTAWSKGE